MTSSIKVRGYVLGTNSLNLLTYFELQTSKFSKSMQLNGRITNMYYEIILSSEELLVGNYIKFITHS